MQIGTLKLYKNVSETIELNKGEGSRYCGKCVINGSTVNYAADTVENLYDIFQKEDGNVYDESECLFEDWYSEYDGIRERVGHRWETGWSVKRDSL